LIRALILERTMSHFCSMCGTHHAKAGSSAMLQALANSAFLIGCDSFRFFNGIQCTALEVLVFNLVFERIMMT
jgi:hypothetical protein